MTRTRISFAGTVCTFLKGRACSDTAFHVVSGAFGHPMKAEEKATMPFAGGILQHGYQCGLIWGAALAAGAQAHRRFGAGPRAETAAILTARELVEEFDAQNHHVNCLEITDLDNSSTTMQQVAYFLLKGGTLGCLRRAAQYAPVAFRKAKAALSEEPAEAPCHPVSCAAELARRMGATEQHAVMAAGLAGGIGLCGGACGALGAAIWILGMRDAAEQDGKVDYKSPKALDTIERFLQCTDYRFECAEIVGRKFEDIVDHAEHFREGGCADLIETLAEG